MSTNVPWGMMGMLMGIEQLNWHCNNIFGENDLLYNLGCVKKLLFHNKKGINFVGWLEWGKFCHGSPIKLLLPNGFEPGHEQICHMQTTKAQISLHIRAV